MNKMREDRETINSLLSDSVDLKCNQKKKTYILSVCLFLSFRRKGGRRIETYDINKNGNEQALMEMKGEESNTTTSAEIDHVTWKAALLYRERIETCITRAMAYQQREVNTAFYNIVNRKEDGQPSDCISPRKVQYNVLQSTKEDKQPL